MDNDNSGFWVWFIIVAVVAIYFWHKSDDLQKQVTELQTTEADMRGCMDKYDQQVNTYNDIITEAKDDLSLGGSYEYESAQSKLEEAAIPEDCKSQF